MTTMGSVLESNPSAAALRGERARLRLRLYDIAPEVEINPIKLGRMLNEREDLPPALARRIWDVMQRMAKDGR
jgi:hypothetical protein